MSKQGTKLLIGVVTEHFFSIGIWQLHQTQNMYTVCPIYDIFMGYILVITKDKTMEFALYCADFSGHI